MKNFKDLIIWQKSIELAIFVYKITEEFPEKEKYGLTSQMRRSVISVAHNK